MSDDLERRLAQQLHAARLPEAPARLRDLVGDLPAVPRQRPARRSRRLPLLLVAAALAGGSVVAALVGAGSRPAVALVSPGPTLAPSPATQTSAPAVVQPSSSALASSWPSSASPSPSRGPTPASGAPTPRGSIGPTPTPRPPLTTYNGTLSVSATFGSAYWDGSLAYPVRIAIVPKGAGLGQAYYWGGNLVAAGFGGTVSSGQPVTSNVVAHYSCDRAVYEGSDPSAITAGVAAWFVVLQGYGAHDDHTLDLVAGCGAVGHAMASPTPAPSGGRPNPGTPIPVSPPVPVTPPPPSSTPVFPTASP